VNIDPETELVLDEFLFFRKPGSTAPDYNWSYTYYLKQRLLFTWTNVGYLNTDHAALLVNIPMLSFFSNIDIAYLPLQFFEVQFINPGDA